MSAEIFGDLLQVQRQQFSAPATKLPEMDGGVAQAETAMRVFVRPKSKELRSCKAEELTDEEVEYEIHSLDGARESLKSVAESIRMSKAENQAEELPKYPIVTFLGTG